MVSEHVQGTEPQGAGRFQPFGAVMHLVKPEQMILEPCKAR